MCVCVCVKGRNDTDLMMMKGEEEGGRRRTTDEAHHGQDQEQEEGKEEVVKLEDKKELCICVYGSFMIIAYFRVVSHQFQVLLFFVSISIHPPLDSSNILIHTHITTGGGERPPAPPPAAMEEERPVVVRYGRLLSVCVCVSPSSTPSLPLMMMRWMNHLNTQT